MKTIWINLLTIARKFKFATLLNLTGFAVAFSAFLIIMMQLHFEYTYEDCYPDAKRIYRVERGFTGGSVSILSRPYIDAVLQSSPHIQAGTLVSPFPNTFYFVIDGDPNQAGYVEKVAYCYPDLQRVFSFEMTEGTADCLAESNKIIIPQSMAIKLFGTQPALGQVLRPMYKEMAEMIGIEYLEIGGVYKDFPKNTQMNNRIYMNMGKESLDNWDNNNFLCYVLLDEQTAPEDLIINFNKHFDFSKYGKDASATLALTPIKDLYYQPDKYNEGYQKTGNKDTSRLLFFISLLVIAVAAINYTNFSTSIAPMRLKSINTQKVLGASDFLLRKTLLAETLTVCLLAYLAALSIVDALSRTDFISFVDTDLDFAVHRPVIWLTGAIAVGIGLIAGLYPAYYMVKFPPAMVLKGSFGLSPAGKRLRTVLVSVQFIVSFALIIGAFFIYAQNQYLRNYNVGFVRDQIAILGTGFRCMQHKDVYVNKLKESPDIEDVAFSMFKFGGTNTYMQWGGSESSYRGKGFGCYVLPVSWNFFDMMEIGYEGQPLNPSYDSPERTYMIPNLKLKNEFDMQVDAKIDVPWRAEEGYTIAGFTDNVNPKSLKYGVENICFMLGGNNYNYYSYVRIKGGSDVRQAVDHIRRTVKEIDPSWPVDIEFFDTIYDNLYKKEQNTSKMIFLFSMLAVVISVMGVFALVVFETQYRYKEIGIRKVHGATIGSILWMFNRHYLAILAGCFVIAAPFAWYGVQEWLQGFAYKTPMHWWIYALTFLIVTFITFATVTYQCWRTAVKNPTDSIKTE